MEEFLPETLSKQDDHPITQFNEINSSNSHIKSTQLNTPKSLPQKKFSPASSLGDKPSRKASPEGSQNYDLVNIKLQSLTISRLADCCQVFETKSEFDGEINF